MRLRDDYTQDCVKGMLRWNKIISLAGYDYKLALPNVAFHRQIGEFKDVHATPDGALIDDATWEKRKSEWLPSTEDGDFIASLMKSETEPGRFAAWISPPKVGIDNKPGDFEYVKIETLTHAAGSRRASAFPHEAARAPDRARHISNRRARAENTRAAARDRRAWCATSAPSAA